MLSSESELWEGSLRVVDASLLSLSFLPLPRHPPHLDNNTPTSTTLQDQHPHVSITSGLLCSFHSLPRLTLQPPFPSRRVHSALLHPTSTSMAKAAKAPQIKPKPYNGKTTDETIVQIYLRHLRGESNACVLPSPRVLCFCPPGQTHRCARLPLVTSEIVKALKLSSSSVARFLGNVNRDPRTSESAHEAFLRRIGDCEEQATKLFNAEKNKQKGGVPTASKPAARASTSSTAKGKGKQTAAKPVESSEDEDEDEQEDKEDQKGKKPTAKGRPTRGSAAAAPAPTTSTSSRPTRGSASVKASTSKAGPSKPSPKPTPPSRRSSSGSNSPSTFAVEIPTKRSASQARLADQGAKRLPPGSRGIILPPPKALSVPIPEGLLESLPPPEVEEPDSGSEGEGEGVQKEVAISKIGDVGEKTEEEQGEEVVIEEAQDEVEIAVQESEAKDEPAPAEEDPVPVPSPPTAVVESEPQPVVESEPQPVVEPAVDPVIDPVAVPVAALAEDQELDLDMEPNAFVDAVLESEEGNLESSPTNETANKAADDAELGNLEEEGIALEIVDVEETMIEVEATPEVPLTSEEAVGDLPAPANDSTPAEPLVVVEETTIVATAVEEDPIAPVEGDISDDTEAEPAQDDLLQPMTVEEIINEIVGADTTGDELVIKATSVEEPAPFATSEQQQKVSEPEATPAKIEHPIAYAMSNVVRLFSRHDRVVSPS